MSDDLIDRLRECAECKSSVAWGRLDGGQDLCIGAALAAEAADELARLRAEVERLTAALSDERAHADAMAEWSAEYRQAIIAVDGGGDFAGKLDRVNQAAEWLDDLLLAHRARRQG